MLPAGDRKGERGTASIELSLSLFWIVFVMLFLIGMGHTLINRQKALVGARFAAFHRSGKGQEAPGALVGRAIKSPETWTVRARSENDSAGVRNDMGGGGGLGIVGNMIDSVLGWIGADGRLTYTSSATPTRGMLPRMFRLRASANYSLVNDPWSCEKGATYLDVFVNSIPFAKDLPIKLGCCKCYQNDE